MQYSACAPHPRRQESREFSGIVTWKVAYSGILRGKGNYKFDKNAKFSNMYYQCKWFYNIQILRKLSVRQCLVFLLIIAGLQLL